MISQETKILTRIEAHIRQDDADPTAWRIDFDNLIAALGSQGMIIRPARFEKKLNEMLAKLIDKKVASVPVTRFAIAQIVYSVANDMDLSKDKLIRQQMALTTKDITGKVNHG